MESTVTAYFEAILRREPTDAQLAFWNAQLTNGMSLDNFAEALLLQATEVRSVIRLYQALFSRVPDGLNPDDSTGGGLSYWVEVFRNVRADHPEMTYKDALIFSIQDWLASDEFDALYGTTSDNADYLSALYMNILGRLPDPGGYDYWLTQLNNNVLTREQLLVEFTESPEFRADVDGKANDLLETAAEIANGEAQDYIIPDDNVYAGKLFNDAPTDLSMSGGAVAENSVAGTVVATLTPTDVDGQEEFTYSIDDPSSKFAISGNQIVVAPGASLDYEANTSYSVDVTVTDKGGNTYVETFVINLSDVNEAPTAINPNAAALDENSVVGTIVAAATTLDPDAGDSHTYTLAPGTPFVIDAMTGVITVAGPIDYEAQSSWVLSVTSTDQGGLSVTETITINVNDVDEAFTLSPSDILLGGSGNDTFTGTVSDALGGTTVHVGDQVDGAGGYDTANIIIEGGNQTFGFQSTNVEAVTLALGMMTNDTRMTATNNEGLLDINLNNGRATGDQIIVRDLQNADGLNVNITDNQGLDVHLDWDSTETGGTHDSVNINLRETFIPELRLTNQAIAVQQNTGIERLNLTSGGVGSAFAIIAGGTMSSYAHVPTVDGNWDAPVMLAGTSHANRISEIDSGAGNGSWASSLNTLTILDPASGPVADLIIGENATGFMFQDIPNNSALGAIVDNTNLTNLDATGFSGNLWLDLLPSAGNDWEGTANLGNGQNVVAVGASLADGVGSINAGSSTLDTAIFNGVANLPTVNGLLNGFEYVILTNPASGTIEADALHASGDLIPFINFADGLNGDLNVNDINTDLRLLFNDDWDNDNFVLPGTGNAEHNMRLDFDNAESDLVIRFADNTPQSLDLLFVSVNDTDSIGPDTIVVDGDGSTVALDIENTFANTNHMVVTGSSFFDLDSTGGNVAGNQMSRPPLGVTDIFHIDASNNSGGIDTRGFYLDAAAGQGTGGLFGGTTLGGSGDDWIVGSRQDASVAVPAPGVPNPNLGLASGHDHLIGNAGDDAIWGLAGDDFIDGGADDDFLDGGIGNDTILGGSGNDTIFGGQGSDNIDAGDGDDAVWGNDGTLAGLVSSAPVGATPDDADVINLGAGNDRANGALGGDFIDGGDGNDRIGGNSGADMLIGGLGADIMEGGGHMAGDALQFHSGLWFDDVLDATGDENDGNTTNGADILIGDGHLGNGALISAAVPGTPAVVRVDISGIVEETDRFEVTITHDGGSTTIEIDVPLPPVVWTDVDVRDAFVAAINGNATLGGLGITAANGPQPSDFDITGPTPPDSNIPTFSVSAQFIDDVGGIDGIQQVDQVDFTNGLHDVRDTYTISYTVNGVPMVQAITLTNPDTDAAFFMDRDYDNPAQAAEHFMDLWNASAGATHATASIDPANSGRVLLTSNLGGTVGFALTGIAQANGAGTDRGQIFTFTGLGAGEQVLVQIDPSTLINGNELSFTGNSLQDVADQINTAAPWGAGVRVVVSDDGNRLGFYDYGSNDVFTGPILNPFVTINASIIGGNGGVVTESTVTQFGVTNTPPVFSNVVPAVDDPDAGDGIIDVQQVVAPVAGADALYEELSDRAADLFIIGNDDSLNLVTMTGSNPWEVDVVLDFNHNMFGWGTSNGDMVGGTPAQGNVPVAAYNPLEGDKISFGTGAPDAGAGEYLELHNSASNYLDALSTANALMDGTVSYVAMSYNGGVADNGDTFLDANENFLLVFADTDGDGTADAAVRLVGLSDVTTQFGVNDIV